MYEMVERSFLEDKKTYTSCRFNPRLLKSLSENQLGPVYGPLAETEAKKVGRF
jgi:hypothetical protein